MNITSVRKGVPPVDPNSSPKYPFNSKIKFNCFQGYELEGAGTLICGPEFKWSFKMPECRAPGSRTPSPRSSTTLATLLSCIFILLLLIVLIGFIFFYRRRQRQKQRKRWQRYFGNYAYRQSKHNITNQWRSVRRSFRSGPGNQRVAATDGTAHDSTNPFDTPTSSEMMEFKKTAATIPVTDL